MMVVFDFSFNYYFFCSQKNILLILKLGLFPRLENKVLGDAKLVKQEDVGRSDWWFFCREKLSSHLTWVLFLSPPDPYLPIGGWSPREPVLPRKGWRFGLGWAPPPLSIFKQKPPPLPPPGSPPPPQSLEEIVERTTETIAATERRVAALEATGEVWGWGDSCPGWALIPCSNSLFCHTMWSAQCFFFFFAVISLLFCHAMWAALPPPHPVLAPQIRFKPYSSLFPFSYNANPPHITGCGALIVCRNLRFGHMIWCCMATGKTPHKIPSP